MPPLPVLHSLCLQQAPQLVVVLHLVWLAIQIFVPETSGLPAALPGAGSCNCPVTLIAGRDNTERCPQTSLIPHAFPRPPKGRRNFPLVLRAHHPASTGSPQFMTRGHEEPKAAWQLSELEWGHRCVSWRRQFCLWNWDFQASRASRQGDRKQGRCPRVVR